MNLIRFVLKTRIPYEGAIQFFNMGALVRGAYPFLEEDREQFAGRDEIRDRLVELISNDSYRAGLLYGTPGVGKTSLIRASLIPHLRENGVGTILCEDKSDPVQSFARGMMAQGVPVGEGEDALSYLGRAVEQAVSGQVYLFVIDDAGAMLDDASPTLVNSLGDFYTRVVVRSRGKARLLFSCASERVHCLGKLERRTGSLFPPNNRVELMPFSVDEAVPLLGYLLGSEDSGLLVEIVSSLQEEGAVLPLQLQIAAQAMGGMGIRSLESLRKLGGIREVIDGWFAKLASSHGEESIGLQLLGVLGAMGRGTRPTATELAQRAGIKGEVAGKLLAGFGQGGLLTTEVEEGIERVSLSHEGLRPYLQQAGAPAMAIARKGRALLTSRADANKRLSWKELREIEQRGIVPDGEQEKRLLSRSKRFFRIAVIASVAVVCAFLLATWILNRSSAYWDQDVVNDGNKRWVVRAGKKGLSWFHWMPSSPSFGAVTSDSGVATSWLSETGKQTLHEGLGAEGAADIVGRLRQPLRGVVEFAATGNKAVIGELAQKATSGADMAALFQVLAPIATGGMDELSLVSKAFASGSPLAQQGALEFAMEAMNRHPGVFEPLLGRALGKEGSAEARRLILAAMRELPAENRRVIAEYATEQELDEETRTGLLAMGGENGDGEGPSALSATALLQSGNLSGETRDKAHELLRRAFSINPAKASEHAFKLAESESAPESERRFALELLQEFASAEIARPFAVSIQKLARSEIEVVRAGALPLLARVDPSNATPQLALLTQESPSVEMRMAIASAWGEVIYNETTSQEDKDAAIGILSVALEKERNSKVRGAVARAFGFSGRVAQTLLTDRIKREGLTVAEGAAFGLANSMRVKASSAAALGGVLRLWKKKGRAKRAAVRVMADMARVNPSRVMNYLVSAAFDKKDTALHKPAVEGICFGIVGQNKSAQRALIRLARHERASVRMQAARCALDVKNDFGTAASLGRALAGDEDVAVRRKAASLLAMAAQNEVKGKRDVTALLRLAADENVAVRASAWPGVGVLGEDSTEKVSPLLQDGMAKGNQEERLLILDAAGKLGVANVLGAARADASSAVRIAAAKLALELNHEVAETVRTALFDSDARVRRGTLEVLLDSSNTTEELVGAVIPLVMNDENRRVRNLALSVLAQKGNLAEVRTLLETKGASISAQERAQVSVAGRSLAKRNAKLAKELLLPLMKDVSHDVRKESLPPLARALAAVHSPAELGTKLLKTEADANLRLAILAAISLQGSDDSKRPAVKTALDKAQKVGGPFTSYFAGVGKNLLEMGLATTGFWQLLVP